MDPEDHEKAAAALPEKRPGTPYGRHEDSTGPLPSASHAMRGPSVSRRPQQLPLQRKVRGNLARGTSKIEAVHRSGDERPSEGRRPDRSAPVAPVQAEACCGHAFIAPSQHVFDCTDRASCSFEALGEAREDVRLCRSDCQQVDGVHHALLPDPVDAADALFEAHGIPGQFEVDDDTAAFLEVQPLAGRIGREQHTRPAAVEETDCGRAFEPVHRTVKDNRVAPYDASKRFKRVAVLGKDDCGFTHASQEGGKYPLLRVVPGGERRSIREETEHAAFLAPIVQARRAQYP
jgi:hypothetical protein